MPIPADHSTTAKAIGLGGVAKMITKAGLNYSTTMRYLAKEKGSGICITFFIRKLLCRQVKVLVN